AATLVAGLLGHLAVAVAAVAHSGPHHLTEGSPRDHAHLAGAAAGGARLDRGAGLGAVAVATLAQLDGLIGDLDGSAVGGLGQVDLGADGDVATLHRATRSTAAAAEDAPEGPSATPEEGVEDVGHRAEGVEVGGVAAAAQALVAVAVVGGTALGVGEHLVCLGGLLELALGLRIVAVDVGVQLAGKP